MTSIIKHDEIENLKEKAVKHLLSGEPVLVGKNGEFAPMLKEFLEKALEAEMGAHLQMRIGFQAGNKTQS